jgi:tripartite-type tricarboxylate transporter receptor subunit TctC
MKAAIICLGAAMVLGTASVSAQTTAPGAAGSVGADYPCARATLIVPYPAGGATDVAARLIADRLEALMKKSFIVENRPGATGNIGTASVASAKADGCTLLVNAAVIATFPSSFSKLAFDPIKDLTPIGGIGITPTVLVAAQSVPAQDIKGLVQLSRQRTDGLSFSTAGYGLLQHLAVEEIARRAEAKFVHVVYKGGAQAATDLIAARVDFGSFAAGSVGQFVKDKQLKPLGIVAESRSALLPDVPTTAEQGLPGLDAGVHFMLYAPAATPKEAIATLNTELNKVVGDPALRQRFADIGFDPTAITSEAAAAIMRKTAADWAPVIGRLNIRLD